MEYSRSYTYTQGDEEKVRLIPFERIAVLHLSHAFFDSFHHLIKHTTDLRILSRLINYRGSFIIGGKELAKLNMEMHIAGPDPRIDRACQLDVKDVLAHDSRGTCYLFRDEGAVTVVEVYHSLRYTRPAKDKVIFIAYRYPYGIPLDKDWYDAEDVLGEGRDGCRREELEKSAEIFLQKFFSEKNIWSPLRG